MGSQQDSRILTMQSAATANGNGDPAETSGVNGAVQVEVVEANTGTVTLNLEGSFDGLNWYAVGYYQIDNTATLTRIVAPIAVAQNSKHVYQVLDPYPQVRARLSSISGATVTVRAYCIPA